MYLPGEKRYEDLPGKVGDGTPDASKIAGLGVLGGLGLAFGIILGVVALIGAVILTEGAIAGLADVFAPVWSSAKDDHES